MPQYKKNELIHRKDKKINFYQYNKLQQMDKQHVNVNLS